MAINFPSSPFSGQVYTYSGTSWEWNGIYWQIYSAQTSFISSLINVGVGSPNVYEVSGGTGYFYSLTGLNGINVFTSGKTIYIQGNGGVTPGSSGISGLSGVSGTSGLSGTTGQSGISGISGLSGVSGTTGQSGISGISGLSGISGISSTPIDTITFTVDTGGASTISTGLKSFVYLPYSGTIQSWTILTNSSGSTKLDIYKTQYSNYPPTSLDTIITSDYPELNNQIKNQSSNLTGWTTNFNVDDVLGLYVVSAQTITRVQLILKIQK